jgi:hypothetical protein
MKPTAKPAQATFAYLAAAMFFLAGVAEIVTGLMMRAKHHAGTFCAIGAMFFSVGCLWIVIAANFKKKARG